MFDHNTIFRILSFMIVRSLLVLFAVLCMPWNVIHGQDAWFYLRAKDTLFSPSFQEGQGPMVYAGGDEELRDVLGRYKIYDFKKTFKKARKEDLKKTFFVRANSKELMDELLREADHIFEFGELIPEDDQKIFEPNDYGLTSTIGENMGLPIYLDYLDFLGVPNAWYYTTGNRDVFIGISDGAVDTTDIEFKGKTKVYRQSSLSRGHGISQAANAAAQGNNGYGMPGVCYDCSIAATTYGDHKNLYQLLELSRAGVRVINCSWVGTRYYQTAQDAIDEMFENGTIVVASAGNRDWQKTKGELLYYPASYDKVISVSSAMHRYEKVTDNLLTSNKGNPYGENIRGYVGRTVGFKEHKIGNPEVVYHVSVATLNPQVDLLAPTVGLFAYSKYTLDDEIWYSPSETTSGASPQVSGTIGLMFSLNPCLPVDEVESILKCASWNIDHIEANKVFAGNYGAGMLHTGRAVKLVHDLYNPEEVAFIENQQFSRWDFKLRAFSKEVRMRNQKFTDSSTLSLTAKNRVILGPNTILKPDTNGSMVIAIDPNMEKECELRLREKTE